MAKVDHLRQLRYCNVIFVSLSLRWAAEYFMTWTLYLVTNREGLVWQKDLT